MNRATHEDGFTLIEILIGIVLTLVVFSAILTVLTSFTNQWQGGVRRLDAQDYARQGIDRIVRQLRNIASPITTPKLLERATPYDVVFQTVGAVNGANSTGAKRVRYCVPSDPFPGSPSTEALIGETQTWNTSTAPADPWSSDPGATIPCPDSPLPSGVTKTVVANAITNRYQGADRPVFTFNNGSTPDPSQLGQVFTVQISLFVNPTPSFAPAESQLRSGAFLRNQPRAPVSDFTWTPTGGGGVLLNGGISYSPDGEDLSYSWACTDPSPCPDAAGLTSADTGLVDWQPGPGIYTVTLTVTDQTGLQKPQTHTVTVT